jgi:flagellar protein FliO/FliZ
MIQLQGLLGESGTKFIIWASVGLAALIAVLLLILVIRRLFGANFNMSGSGDKRNRPPRLGVTDFFNLDRQGRLLVIVRRDNVEHLVLIGGPNDLLIEQNIIRGIRPELPIVEPSTRPTVISKASDDMTVDAPRAEPVEQRVKTAPPELTPIPVSAKLNTQKLNIPNLDLRASTPAIIPATIPAVTPIQKSALAAIEPAKAPATAPPVMQAPVILAPETKIEAVKHPALPEIATQKPIEVPLELAPTVQPALVPPRKPLISTFGDAAKRLEEALRRPIEAAPPKPAELKVEAQKPIEQKPIVQKPIEHAQSNAQSAPVIATPTKTEPQKPVEDVKQEMKTEAKPVQSPNQPAQTQPAPIQPATDTLVLDLEQEMARLLGRTPGKGL